MCQARHRATGRAVLQRVESMGSSHAAAAAQNQGAPTSWRLPRAGLPT